MTMTSIGFNGTVNDAAWARLARLVGQAPCTERAGDLPVTQVSGSRALRFGTNLTDTGTSKRSAVWGEGILTTFDATETLNIPAPSGSNTGQWFLVVLTRVWTASGGSTALNARSGPAAAAPAFPPTTFPGTFLTNPGSNAGSDVALGWAWSSSTSTDITYLPLIAPGTHLGRSGTAAQRDAMFAAVVPLISAAYGDVGRAEDVFSRVAGSWYNADTLCLERYIPGTIPPNPANGNNSNGELSGSVVTNKAWLPAGGLMPAVALDAATTSPSTYTVFTTSGGTNNVKPVVIDVPAPGVNRGFQFNPAVGLFTCPYRGRYQFGALIRDSAAVNADVRLFLIARSGSRGGTTIIGILGGTGGSSRGGVFPPVYCEAGDTLDIDISNNSSASITISASQRQISAEYLGA